MVATRVLLTGATGFVGGQVRAHLGHDIELHCTSRGAQVADGASWHVADLRDPAACQRLIAELRPAILVHAAWNTAHGQFWEAEDNADWLEAGKALFAAFAQHGGRRIVGCGSCAEYAGASSARRREDEDRAAAEPATLYGRSKLELLRFLRDLPVDHAWARIFLAYGPGEGKQRLVPSVARALLADEEVRCSSGRQIRDFMDVRDLGRAIALLAMSGLTGAINLGQGEDRTIGEVAILMGELSGRPDLIRLGALPDRAGEAPRLSPDLSRQHDELGFTPAIGLRQGLADALDWWSTRY
jgi:nucleoside-diphosphate-sugar epimerase